MDLAKAKRFNEKMGKAKHYPRHQNLSKGGMVDKRKHFADGGVSANTTQSTAGSAGLGFGNQPSDSVFSPGLGLYNPVGFTNAIGGVAQGIGAAFTPQNQFQAQLAPTENLNYAPTIAGGTNSALNAGTVNSAIGAEQGLASQYGDIAAGRGPNPAQTMLNQQTGRNVANTAALQAGQRGGAANAGLLARQIGQQGAATQQEAVGQGATLQANQQLGALGAQGALQGQIAQQGLGEQGIGANVLGAGAGALNAQNANQIANYGQAQGLNQQTAQANAAATQKTVGGLTGGVGALLSFLDEGGDVHPKMMADGGSLLNAPVQMPGAPVQPLAGPTLDMQAMPGAPMAQAPGPGLNVDTSMPNPENSTIATGVVKNGGPDDGASSIVGKILGGGKSKDGDDDPTGFKGLGSGIGTMFSGKARGGMVGPHKSHVANYLFAEGGTTESVPALVSPNEVSLDPHQVREVVERGADPMLIGHRFPGHDKVGKNSQKNDIIPTMLEDGGVVIPISITTHKDASNKARKFVEKAHAKRYMKKPKGI